MGKIVPGRPIRYGHAVGLLGGLYVQTTWQKASRRDEIASWYHLNSYLTVKPHEFFLSYLTYGSKACSFHTRKNLCLLWLKYFFAADVRRDSPRRDDVGRLLWRAHMESIYTGIRDRPGILDNPAVPFEERYFVKGWIRFVQHLANINFPTTEKISQSLSDKGLPLCSPLGAKWCKVRQLPLVKRAFVKKIILLGRVTEGRARSMAPDILRSLDAELR
ncbi:hypothetical protein [Bdellovibrio bacteriovorus]|uniref:hypothetical protein n=1 Tax=Bdellovibrio bacteriovorus TaxID=959 RepID=UPI0035A8F18D